MAFDKWALLKVFEVGFVVACLITKRVTDDEASRLFLYLQKLSREWSLLNNVTWDKVGAAVADTTYGGYIIITFALLMGRLTGELPTTRRVTEMIFLGIGALLFVVLGSLEFAALDSVPPDLVDNAAVLGTLSLVTAALFLLDLGGPRAKKEVSEPQKVQKKVSKPQEAPNNKQASYTIEPELERMERKELEALEQHSRRARAAREQNGQSKQNGHGLKIGGQNGFKTSQNGYKKMTERDSGRRFDIYGKDADAGDYGGQDETDAGHEEPIQMERHSPVWSQIRKGQYGKYDVVVPSYLYPKTDTAEAYPETQPSSPGDPGYVQYTAKRWGQPSQKTPRHSPTQLPSA